MSEWLTTRQWADSWGCSRAQASKKLAKGRVRGLFEQRRPGKGTTLAEWRPVDELPPPLLPGDVPMVATTGRDDVLDSLTRHGPMTTAEIVEDTGRSFPSVARHLWRMARDGRVKRRDPSRRGQRGRAESVWRVCRG